MAYKLIASDMDGTLLDPDKRISPKVEAAVRRACADDVIFCLASGRPLCGLRRYIDQLGLTSPVITCNGSVIMQPDGRVLWQRCLEAEAAREVLSFADRFDVTLCVWSSEQLFVNHINDRTRHYQQSMQIEKMTLISDWEPVIAAGIDKILWHDEADRVLRYQAILNSEMQSRVNYFTSNPRFLEFIDWRASKAVALIRLTDFYRLDISQTIAVGDGFNDLEMLQTAGMGVAMGNAPDEIKRQCDWVAPSNEHDGMAAVIYHFLYADI